MNVVGIDPSLTAAGVAVVAHPDIAATPNAPVLRTVGAAGEASDTLAATARRIERQMFAILRAMPQSVNLVVIEALPLRIPDPSYASKYLERGQLLGDLILFLVKRNIPVVTVNPSTLKKFATGNGRAEKNEVREAMQMLWPHAQLGKDNNRGDALALASAGAIDGLGWYPREAVHHHLDPKVWAEIKRPKEIERV